MIIPEGRVRERMALFEVRELQRAWGSRMHFDETIILKKIMKKVCERIRKKCPF